MNFDDILLALLARHPSSGYALKQWFDVEGIVLRAHADQAQIYRTLRKLEKRGAIAHVVVSGSGGPSAKVYAVTESGAEHLRHLSQQPYHPPTRWQEPDFVAWMLLLAPLSPASALAAADRELALRRAQLATRPGRMGERLSASGPAQFSTATADVLSSMVREQARASLESWIAWVESLRARLREVVDGGAVCRVVGGP